MTADSFTPPHSSPDPVRERTAFLFMLEDLERERNHLKQKQNEWRIAFDAVTDPIFLYDKSYRILRANSAYAAHAGMSISDITGRLYFEVFPKLGHPIIDSLKNTKQGLAKSELHLETGEVFLSKDFPVHDAAGAYLFSLHLLEDITQIKQADKLVRRTRRALKLPAACIHEMLQADDEVQMLQTVCRVAVESGGYRIAWVGYAEQDDNKSVRPVVFSGYETDFPSALHPTWADTEHGNGPVGTAIRTGKTHLIQNVIDDPQLAYLHRDSVQHGYASTIGLPLSNDAGVFGALCLCAEEPFAFSEEEVAVLEEFAAIIAFGVTAFRLRIKRNEDLQERTQHLDALCGGLEDVIGAIGIAIEGRHNPYAVEHQNRVADIARAIALEMGFSEEQAHGLRLAGMLHDVGELRIPEEIIGKPGKLTDEELARLMEHPQFGYDILKQATLPWPVAQAVLQHHERLDGSGYPKGLKGDEILPEARIIAVADAIDALAFEQRPSHPRLGISAALLEIEKHKGTLYDEAVVNAAIRLFREKEFTV
jgi:HD-GYP domain-containing protein (c-di-GMP phosphodiesterase class II)